MAGSVSGGACMTGEDRALADGDEIDALVIGGGPAGLMAAEALAGAERRVLVAERMPSPGRKLLMAGKSGLNLSNVDGSPAWYGESAGRMAPMLAAFGAAEVRRWAEGLGEATFAGPTGRVFPKAMKASPLLRAWLGRLAAAGVEWRTRWRWTGWADGFAFDTPGGARVLRPRVAVLATGGASWARLGADGAWAPGLAARGVPLAPFEGANVGLRVDWSPHIARQFGAPVKDVKLVAGDLSSRGEFAVSARGIEGGAVYAVDRAVRAGAPLVLDLLPNRSAEVVRAALAGGRRGDSLSSRLRKGLRLAPVKAALLREWMPEGADMAEAVKALPVPHRGPRPMDEAISVAGGVRWEGVDEGLMLRALPGVFAAGEMLDWEAPTGGWLLTGCLSTGRWAGEHAARWTGGAG